MAPQKSSFALRKSDRHVDYGHRMAEDYAAWLPDTRAVAPPFKHSDGAPGSLDVIVLSRRRSRRSLSRDSPQAFDEEGRC